MENVTKGVRTNKRARISGHRNRLSVQGKDPNFEYRIVNDVEEGQRVQMFKESGWEIVTDKEINIGEKRVNSVSPEGSLKQIHVGQGTKAYLMKIKKEWFDEDQATKQQHVDELEAGLKPNDTYGKVDIKRS